MDNLARCAMLARKDGMSYGQWMAIHGEKVAEKKTKKKEEVNPEGWKPCEYCGKLFRAKGSKRFCELECRTAAYYENNSETIIKKVRDYQKRYREEKRGNANCG